MSRICNILLLVLFVTFCCAPVSAQVLGEPQETIREVYEEAFSRLDLTETETGILANRNAYLIDYSPYEGSTGAPALTGPAWEVAYLQLRHAALDPSGLPAPEAVEAEAEAHFASDRAWLESVATCAC